MPGQGEAEPPPGAPPPGLPGLAGQGPFPPVGRSPRSERRRVWPVFLVLFLVAVLIILGVCAHKIYGLFGDTGEPRRPAAGPPAAESPRPEPVSTVRPRVPGWKAVSSAKYGMAYDVPRSWRITPSTTLRGYEGVDGGAPAMMSSVAAFRDGGCKDVADTRSRAIAGFNQYVEGAAGQVAEHAAGKWAKHAYHFKGVPAPSVTLGAPEAVTVGSARAVHVRADVVVNGGSKCAPPAGIVHVVAVPGVEAGLTTVFVVVTDRDVPDAAPAPDIGKVLGSLRYASGNDS